MKKTQKILALIMAVIMISSCFGMIVLAEDTEMITVVGVEKVGDNEYVVEFSAPITYKYSLSTFRRPSPEDSTGQNVNYPAVEYLGDFEEINGKKYSNLVKLTFEEAAANLDLAGHGIAICEYNQNTAEKGDVAGAISPAVLCGVNGELVKSNYTNANGTLDFVWLPMDVANANYSYLPHIVNTYEDDVVLLGVEVSEDFTTYIAHFSAPVKIPQNSCLFLRTTTEAGPPQPSSPTIEYIDNIKYASGTYSKTIKLTFNKGEVNASAFKEATLDYTTMGLVFTEYNTSTLPHNVDYLAPGRLASVNGRRVKGNYQNKNNQDFIWVPVASADTMNEYKVHLSQGNPIALDASWHAQTEEILVTFSEAVSFAEEGAYLCVGGPESETKVALTASATDKGNVIALAVGELPEAFAEGNFGIAFADGFIKDADEKALEVNFIGEEANFFYIPTDVADAEDEYPLDLDVHEIVNSEKDETNHWEECECGYILEETVAEHDYAAKKGITEGHWGECSCGAKTETVAHEFTAVDYDTENHWFECGVCEFIQEESIEPHNFTKVDHDDNGHWTECECGEKTEAVAHEFVGDYDDNTHWTECECGEKTEAVAHEFDEDGACACGKGTYVLGDVNEDEEVNASDAIYLLYNVFFTEARYPINQPTDFNADGVTNASDAIYLLYHVFFGEVRYPLFPEAVAE